MENINLPSIPFELASLSQAVNYQDWVKEAVFPFLGKRILELGSGIGTMSQHLPARERLYLTESSALCYPTLHAQIESRQKRGELVFGEQLDLTTNWVERLTPENFDTVISFNVMEHIEDDLLAFTQQYQILKNSKFKGPKHLVAFVPAHPWLMGSLDHVFEHYRRYNKKRIHTLFNEIDPSCTIKMRYFNLVGVLGWFVTGRILKKKEIGIHTIRAFEKIVPLIRRFDDWIHEFLHFPLGQSLLVVVEIK